MCQYRSEYNLWFLVHLYLLIRGIHAAKVPRIFLMRKGPALL